MSGWAWKQFPLWTVSRVGGGALANERAANISWANPRQVNPWWLYGIVSVQVGALNGATFSGVRIYGSHSQLGFPPAGQAADSIVVFPAVGGPNQGLFRTLRTRTIAIGAGVEETSPLVGIPPFLLLEYDMAAGGAGTSQLNVFATFYGPEMTGHE